MKRVHQGSSLHLGNFNLLFGLPYELIELLCSYLKFNTGLFITCKRMYAQRSQYRLQCASGNHFVKLVHAIDRIMPTECKCANYNQCSECQRTLMPAFVPTRFVSSRPVLFQCDKCVVSSYWWKITSCHDYITNRFTVDADGVHTHGLLL